MPLQLLFESKASALSILREQNPSCLFFLLRRHAFAARFYTAHEAKRISMAERHRKCSGNDAGSDAAVAVNLVVAIGAETDGSTLSPIGQRPRWNETDAWVDDQAIS